MVIGGEAPFLRVNIVSPSSKPFSVSLFNNSELIHLVLLGLCFALLNELLGVGFPGLTYCFDMASLATTITENLLKFTQAGVVVSFTTPVTLHLSGHFLYI